MPRRKRKRKTARRVSQKPTAGAFVHRLRAQLAHVQLPAPVEPPPPIREVTEAELMELAYTAIATGEPLDLDTIIELPVAQPTPPRFPDPAPAPDSPPQVSPPPPTPKLSLDRIEGAAFAGKSWQDQLPAALLHLHNQPLTAPQQSLLRKAAKAAVVPELNIRQLPRVRALERVAAFVGQQRLLGVRYIRVITGKGLSSRGDPVLKPAVIAYCEGPGRESIVAWAPERDRQGAFGSLILRLRSHRQHPV